MLKILVISYNFICQILSKNAEERDLTFHRQEYSVVDTWEVKKCEPEHISRSWTLWKVNNMFEFTIYIDIDQGKMLENVESRRFVFFLLYFRRLSWKVYLSLYTIHLITLTLGLVSD